MIPVYRKIREEMNGIKQSQTPGRQGEEGGSAGVAEPGCRDTKLSLLYIVNGLLPTRLLLKLHKTNCCGFASIHRINQ